MSVIKVLRDLNGLFNYSTDENPTSQQDYQKAVKNWVKTIVSLVDSNLWQPETEYTVGSQLLTPSLPYYVLRCTVAGTSGAAEPDYTDVALGDKITDGTVTWVVDGYLPLSGGSITGDVDITGDLSVSGKEIERVSAKGTYGIRFESGIQMCWGELSIPAGTADREVSGTMTFQYPFPNTNYVLTFGNDWCTSSNEYYRAEGRNTANFKFTAVGVSKNPHMAFYIAIGYWK